MPQHPSSQNRTSPRPGPGSEPPTRRLPPAQQLPRQRSAGQPPFPNRPQQHPARPGPVPHIPVRPQATTAAEQHTAAAPATSKAPELSLNKVIAGAGAAATSAVLGSFFGATGTVMGAALGSVASTVATVVYQRSLDRTRDTLVQRIRLIPGRRVHVATTPPDGAPKVSLPLPPVPMQRMAPEQETVRIPVEPGVAPDLRRHRRHAGWLWAGATVLVFLIGLLAVTGIEWAKGSTLTTGQTGTSVGRVFTGGDHRRTPPAEEHDTTATPEPSDSAGPTTEPTGTPSTEPPTEQATPSESPESDTTQAPQESEIPGLGNDEGFRSDRSDGSDSRAPRTPLVPIPSDSGQ